MVVLQRLVGERELSLLFGPREYRGNLGSVQCPSELFAVEERISAWLDDSPLFDTESGIVDSHNQVGVMSASLPLLFVVVEAVPPWCGFSKAGPERVGAR